MNRARLLEPGIVTTKELTQLANRPRFHAEKGIFAVIVAGVFAFMAFSQARQAMTVAAMAEFGRYSFFSVSVAACIILSVFSMGMASGIISNERTGKRLDILRITPMSLGTIVLGKGLAVVVKSLLVLGLLAPIVAAAQLFGGVSSADIAKAALIIVADIVFSTAVGLFVSAGARTNTDRVVRCAEFAFLWLWAGGLMFMLIALPLGRLSARTPRAYIYALSPMMVWVGLVGAKLSWGAALTNVVVTGGLGVWLAWLSVRKLRKVIVKEQEPPPEPKVRDFFAGFRRRRARKRGNKQVRRQRRWAGTLVGGQVARTSLIPILVPLATVMPILVVVAVNILTNRMLYWRAEDTLIVGGVISVVTAAMIALQASASIAREKQIHMAELVATTPAGGQIMLWWKSAAIGLVQALNLALCVLVVAWGGASVWSGAVGVWARVLGVIGLMALAWSAGLSFSLVSKTPIGAGALLAVTFFLLVPFVRELVAVADRYYLDLDVLFPSEVFGLCLVCLLGMALLVIRQFFGRGAVVALMVGLVLVLAAGPALLFCAVGDSMTHFECIGVPFKYAWGFEVGGAVWIALAQLALSAVLVAGAHFRFTRTLLRGARSKGGE